MKWYENFDEFLHQFEVSNGAMDKTAFSFRTDPLAASQPLMNCFGQDSVMFRMDASLKRQNGERIAGGTNL